MDLRDLRPSCQLGIDWRGLQPVWTAVPWAMSEYPTQSTTMSLVKMLINPGIVQFAAAPIARRCLIWLDPFHFLRPLSECFLHNPHWSSVPTTTLLHEKGRNAKPTRQSKAGCYIRHRDLARSHYLQLRNSAKFVVYRKNRGGKGGTPWTVLLPQNWKLKTVNCSGSEWS